MAKRTAVGLNEIRKLINVEQKYKELSTNPSYSNTGSITYLSGLDQGDTTITREGNSIKIQKFYLKFFAKHNPANTGTCTHRAMVVRDLQNQGATIVANDVLETVGSAYAPIAFKDFVNGPHMNKRFAVVYDKLFVTHPYKPIFKDEFSTNHDCHVYFRGGDGSVTSAGNGSYFLILLCSDSTNLPDAYVNTRLEFTDN